MEYAKADKRWGGADLTVVSLELLTVLVAGPLAVYVCELVRRQDAAGLWFWASVLATGEIYGGRLALFGGYYSALALKDGEYTSMVRIWLMIG